MAHSDVGWRGVHHVGFLVESLERSKAFYEDTLGVTQAALTCRSPGWLTILW